MRINIVPFLLIGFLTTVGAIVGAPLTGLAIGLGIVILATLID